MLSFFVCDRSGQGTRRTSGADLNGKAVRPFTPQKEARPSQLTGALMVGLRTKRRRTLALCRLSYVANDGGTRTRNHPVEAEGTPVCAADRLEFQENATNAQASSCCEPRSRTRFSWFRARCGSRSTSSHRSCIARSGRRDSNSQPPASDAGARPIALRPVGTHGESRTRTTRGLSAVPLPVGLRELVRAWTRRESNPQPSPCKGAVASSAAGPLVAGAGIEPATRGV